MRRGRGESRPNQQRCAASADEIRQIVVGKNEKVGKGVGNRGPYHVQECQKGVGGEVERSG